MDAEKLMQARLVEVVFAFYAIDFQTCLEAGAASQAGEQLVFAGQAFGLKGGKQVPCDGDSDDFKAELVGVAAASFLADDDVAVAPPVFGFEAAGGDDQCVGGTLQRLVGDFAGGFGASDIPKSSLSVSAVSLPSPRTLTAISLSASWPALSASVSTSNTAGTRLSRS
ncbi:hypothetical protein [Methylogaea oryzae]|uniref:hypothetical protein n=1 Tax=Methylogaea oryzae TaxID=1295382 RepID=UPI00138F4078|nr:hypothetical protein [Methylogaea oryzae]